MADYDEALCLRVGDPDDWHPPEPLGRPGRKPRDPYIPAKLVCAACPVRPRCLADHLDERYGVWGGTDPEQRRTLRLVARETPTAPVGAAG